MLKVEEIYALAKQSDGLGVSGIEIARKTHGKCKGDSTTVCWAI